MYTEFIFGAELKKDTPKYIIEGLNRVINHYSAEDMVNIERANIITENGLQTEPIDFISPEAVKFIHEYDLYGLLYSMSIIFHPLFSQFVHRSHMLTHHHQFLQSLKHNV